MIHSQNGDDTWICPTADVHRYVPDTTSLSTTCRPHCHTTVALMRMQYSQITTTVLVSSNTTSYITLQLRNISSTNREQHFTNSNHLSDQPLYIGNLSFFWIILNISINFQNIQEPHRTLHHIYRPPYTGLTFPMHACTYNSAEYSHCVTRLLYCLYVLYNTPIQYRCAAFHASMPSAAHSKQTFHTALFILGTSVQNRLHQKLLDPINT